MGLGLKATLALFVIYCMSPSDFLIIPDSSTTALWQLPEETSGSEAEETW
jgi:hypothetical protein